MATVWDGVAIEHCHPRRKFYWTALLRPPEYSTSTSNSSCLEYIIRRLLVWMENGVRELREGKKILSLVSDIKPISRGLNNKGSLLSCVTKWYKRKIRFARGLIQPRDHLSTLHSSDFIQSSSTRGHKMAASSSQSQSLPPSCLKGDRRSLS